MKKHNVFLKPRIHSGVLFMLLVFYLAGCSGIVVPIKIHGKKTLATSEDVTLEDYEQHLANLKDAFLKNPDLKLVKLSPSEQKYFSDFIGEILISNEIFFKKIKQGNVTVLNTETPIHFSLPKGEIFLSKGLLAKYIKNESLLACLLSFELLRSEKILYTKQTIIPTGYLPLERMMTFMRLSLEEKMEAHKWARLLMMRTGYDGEYYLGWLQIQNRNTADFVFQIGDANQINREESLFKAFLIKHIVDQQVTKKTSSKAFYQLINSLRENS